MDLVSFDTKGEFEMFAEIMKRGDYISSVIVKFIIATPVAIPWRLLPCFVHGPKI